MFSSLLNAMFGCSHKRTTFPITPARRTQLSAESVRRGTYVACLDCGKEFDYSWKDMKISDVAMTAAHASSLTAVNH
jgi:hypothetical protein